MRCSAGGFLTCQPTPASAFLFWVLQQPGCHRSGGVSLCPWSKMLFLDISFLFFKDWLIWEGEQHFLYTVSTVQIPQLGPGCGPGLEPGTQSKSPTLGQGPDCLSRTAASQGCAFPGRVEQGLRPRHSDVDAGIPSDFLTAVSNVHSFYLLQPLVCVLMQELPFLAVSLSNTVHFTN